MPILTTSTTSTEFPGDLPGRALGGDLFAILGDVVLGVVNDHGVRVHLADLSGWWESPDSTGSSEQRAHDHGGWLGSAHLGPRVVQFVVRLRGSSWEHLNQTLSDITAAIPLQGLAPLYVHDHGAVTMAWVRQEGAPLVKRRGVGAEVSFSLVAPDPRRYDVDEVTVSTRLPTTSGGLSLPLSLPLSIGATVESGVLSATNEGNFPTRPTLTATGPTQPFTVTHKGTGETLRYHEAVPSGRFLVIDVDRRRALLDGTTPRRVTGQWFEYAPGLNEVAFQSQTYNDAALLTSTHRHAWR